MSKKNSKVKSLVIRNQDKPTVILVYRVVDGMHHGLLFQCCMNAFGRAPKCSECSYCVATLASGKPCRNRACLDSELCTRHIRQKFNVVIAESTIPNGGLGIFAARRRPLRYGSTIVFRRGDFIAPYGGVRMTNKEFDKLYDFHLGSTKYVSTGPYAIQAENGDIIDGLCLRRVGAYANHYQGSDAERPNAQLAEDGLYALCDIRPDEEILLDYGDAYWETQRFIQIEQKQVSPDASQPMYQGRRGFIVRR